MTKKEAKLLFEKYRRGLCTREELAILESWYIQYARQNDQMKPDDFLMESDLAEIWSELPVNKRNFRFNRHIRQMAASIVLCIGIVASLLVYMGFFNEEKSIQQQFVGNALTAPDTSKGDEGYILLEDGRVIPLSSRVSGTIFEDKEIKINKFGGRIVYAPEERSSFSRPVDSTVYSTVVVPKGKQYELVLADGTQVWLNSFSSIRFPDKFGHGNRSVEITGEAYFEIARDLERPFTVTTGQHTIRVLGTHFNINAYEDEREIRTTVLEGSVEVKVSPSNSKKSLARVLRPGQQSRFSSARGDLNVVAIDTEEVIAWKSGLILFEDTALETILRQIGRWYDIEVEYRGVPPQRRFTGGVSRNAPVSEFLKVLEINDIQFTTEGRKLIILNK